MDINPDSARKMLVEADRLSDSVRLSDTIRRNVYRIQIFVLPLVMAPYDLFEVRVAVPLCLTVLAVSVLLIFRELRRSKVINREAMVSYTVVIASWSVLWVILMTLVGPWLSERLAIGWTLTGLIGTLPYVAGLLWERR